MFLLDTWLHETAPTRRPSAMIGHYDFSVIIVRQLFNDMRQ
jgi:hypothetical protein